MAEKSQVNWDEQPLGQGLSQDIQEKMSQWMTEKSQADSTDQPLSQPSPPPPDTASCPLDTTHPFIKGQVGGVQPETEVQQAFNQKQPNPIPTEINASPQLDTTPPFIKGQESGVQPEIPVEQAFNLEEWMTPESLRDIANDLEYVANAEGSEAVGLLEDVRAWVPSEALKAAANLLPKPLRNRIAEMVRAMNAPVETKPTSEQKSLIVIPRLPQATKTNKPPAPPLSKEEESYAEWSQLHNLIKVANEFLAPLSKILPDQAIEKIKHLLTFVPSKAVALAAGLLTGDIRDIIEQLLLGFNIAID